MPVIEKMRIATAAAIKNALGIIITMFLLFRHLNKRVALSGKKSCKAYTISKFYKFFLFIQIIDKKVNNIVTSLLISAAQHINSAVKVSFNITKDTKQEREYRGS